MFSVLALATGLIALGAAQRRYSFSQDNNMPSYIKKALHQKNAYKGLARQKIRTIENLTLTEVFEKIKDITRALNVHAKKNGYGVDYKFRIFEKGK